ncbi:MAG: CoA transferase subunit A [Myxococcota bacterium]
MPSKVCDSALAALAGLRDGQAVMVGGFGLSGNPEALIAAVLETGAKNLTLISNNAGSVGRGLARWLKAGIVGQVICSYVGNNVDLQAALDDGSVQVQIIPQGTLVERIRAAGAGIPAFFTPTGAGTVVAEGKEERTIDGRACILEHALHADFALIRARYADAFGNVRYWRTSQNFQTAMATAARIAVVEAEEVVSLGAIDPDDVHLSGGFVQRVVYVGEHEDFIEKRTLRAPD